MAVSARWIAALPLLLIPCCWLWWWAGGLNPGLEIGRSAAVLLLLGCAAAAWVRQVPTAALPLLLALAWQALSLAWAPITEPGALLLVERAAACATALALSAWLSGRPDHGGNVAAAGLGILALTALTQTSLAHTLRLGVEAPFGNVNFAVGAALPLAAIALARASGSWRWLPAAGLVLALTAVLGRGWLGGDPCWAAWLGAGTALIAIIALRLPAQAHLPILAALAVALLALLAVTDLGSLGAGAAHRPWIWQAAYEALAGPALLVGHGPGTTLAVLPAQPAFAAAWLAVPSWPEHAHHEALQVLLDGGLVLAGLLAWALWATIAPLWRERHDPAAAALLIAWIVAGALACIESHLGKPGGMLCLALLAGATWARQPGQPLPGAARILPPAIAVLLAFAMWRELARDGGGPVSIDDRTRRTAAEQPMDERLATYDRLRARLGPLDDLDLLRARALGGLRRHDEAAAALAAHLDRLPVDAQGLALARRMRLAMRATPTLLAAEARARQRAQVLLTQVPENPVNHDRREALIEALAAGDPVPER